MIEGEKLVNEIKALKLKYCNHWEESYKGDAYYGGHGYLDAMLNEAIKYGFEQGESFGKQVKYAEKVMNECLIQPENDRAWREQLETIQKDENITNPAWKSEKLLELIAEMILYRRNGG